MRNRPRWVKSTKYLCWLFLSFNSLGSIVNVRRPLLLPHLTFHTMYCCRLLLHSSPHPSFFLLPGHSSSLCGGALPLHCILALTGLVPAQSSCPGKGAEGSCLESLVQLPGANGHTWLPSLTLEEIGG